MSDTLTEYPFDLRPAPEAVAQQQRIAMDRPLTRVAMQYGDEAWAIHRYAVAQQVLTDPRFVRGPFARRERIVPAAFEFPEFLLDTLQFADGEEHKKLRRLVQVAISPRRVQALRERTTEIANELIDEMIAKGDTANLAEDYATPLPIRVLSEFIGVPVEDQPKFIEWATTVLSLDTPEEQVMASGMALYTYLLDLLAARREEPREDLLSSLANARDKDDTLTDAEIMPIAKILLVAGFDNTAGFLAAGVSALLRNHDQRERLLEDLDGRIAPAVEEILRHAMFEVGSPMSGGMGTVAMVATEDVELDGVLVKAGEAVYVDPASVNHDPAAFKDSQIFDILREDSPQMMLSYGIHSCLGAPLARMEMQVGIAELFRRLPGLRLNGEIVRNMHVLTIPVTDLPVAW